MSATRWRQLAPICSGGESSVLGKTQGKVARGNKARSAESDLAGSGVFTAGIVKPKWAADAQHVAAASVNRCRVIVSWNFKHIVHFDKIPLSNGVNLINGYDTLSINTPAEVISYEE